MATGDRTKRITDRVQLLLGLTDNDKIPLTHIYATMDDGISDMAERLLCLEASASVTFTTGTATEPAGFYRMKLITLATGVMYHPVEVSVEEYDSLTRYSPSNAGSKGMWYKRWNGTITTYPALDDGAYTVLYYKSPTTLMSAAADPDTPAKYDTTVEYYTIFHLAPYVGKADLVPLYKKMHEEALKDAIESWRRTKPSGGGIYYQDV